MYGQPSSSTVTAMGAPVSSLGIMFEQVWMVFAIITIIFILVSIWQLVRPTGNFPRP
jgi:hypothetical protein